MFSEQVNPWMALIKSTAETLRETRSPLPDDHPAIVAERALSARTGEGIGAWRKGRDAWITRSPRQSHRRKNRRPHQKKE